MAPKSSPCKEKKKEEVDGKYWQSWVAFWQLERVNQTKKLVSQAKENKKMGKSVDKLM